MGKKLRQEAWNGEIWVLESGRPTLDPTLRIASHIHVSEQGLSPTGASPHLEAPQSQVNTGLPTL